MKKRISASNIMRVVSILGIICLLALQWVWWRNAYRAVEMDMLNKAQECLKRSSSDALLFQMDSTSKNGIKIYNENVEKVPENMGKKSVSHRFNSTIELEYLFEQYTSIMNIPITENKIDQRLIPKLKKELGFVPKHSLRIRKYDLPSDSTYNPKINRIVCNQKRDMILHQFGYKSYVVLEISSPYKMVYRKGKSILLVSLLLVLLVGSILVLQYRNMRRDRKFADFIIDYTRMMTHDLRTPVTGIQMIFNMFQKNQFSDETVKEKYLAEGMALSKKVLLNLDNILYMAKSEQREFQINRTEVAMKDFVENTLKPYRERDYHPKTVAIETLFEPESFNCMLDANLMENVFCNLMENAIKFTGVAAMITVTCKLEKDVVEIRFRDNGFGMTKEDQKRIFEIFERGSANNNKQFPGFGIGLHFVQRVVKAHGGKITVNSTVGQGSEFIIRFFS